MAAISLAVFVCGLQMLGILVSAETEQALIFNLLDRYSSKNGRPVTNTSEPVKLKIGLSLIRVNCVDQEAQTLSSSVFLKMMWNDAFLKWDASEYGGLERVALEEEDIWTPDIELFNAVKKPEKLTSSNNRIVVKSDGEVINVPYLKLTSACPSNPDEDMVTCNLKFGSWVYPSPMVALEALDTLVETDFYNQHREWEVHRTSLTINHKTYDCCPDQKYSDITFSLTLKRRNKKVKAKVISSAGKPRGSITAAILALFTLTAAVIL